METPDFAQAVQDKQKAARDQHIDTVKHNSVIKSQDAIQQAVIESAKANIQHRDQHEPKVTVTNPVEVSNLGEVTKAVDKIAKAVHIDFGPLQKSLQGLTKAVDTLPHEQITFPEPPESVSVSNLSELTDHFSALATAIKSLDVAPQVKVAAPNVEIKTDPVDLGPITDGLSAVRSAIAELTAKEQPEPDITPLIVATESVTNAIQALRFPVPNYVLPFKDTTGADTQLTLTSNGNLPVTSSTHAVRLDSATTTNVTYVGKAAIGTLTSAASWQIFKMDETVSNTLTITWAGGASSFNQVWNNRAGLTYS